MLEGTMLTSRFGRILLLATLCVMVAQVSMAQDSLKSLKSIGVSYSAISGHGLTYYTSLSDEYGIRINGLFYYKDEDYEKRTYINLGFELQKNIYHGTNHRFYWLNGTNFGYNNQTGRPFDLHYNGEDEMKVWEIGTGIGYQLNPDGDLSLLLDLAYQFRLESDGNTNSFFVPAFGFGVVYNLHLKD